MYEPIHMFHPRSLTGKHPRHIRITNCLSLVALLGSLAIAMGCGGGGSVQSSTTTTNPQGVPLSIATQTLSSATETTPYSVGLAAMGGVPPYSWEVSSGTLPGGFTLASNTGVLSGTTTQIGTFIFSATVTDSKQT